MRIFKSLGTITPHAHGFDAGIDKGWRLRVRAMDDALLRIVIEPETGLPLKKSWMIAPEGDVPWEGRDREDIAGFSSPAIKVSTEGGVTILTAGQFRLTLTGSPLRIAVAQLKNGEWLPWIADRPTGGFALTEKGQRIRHYQERPFEDRHFGLGDKSGPLDRTGRRFRVLQLDALGFDAEIGDPLYKHIPYLAVQSAGVTGGLFYDSLAPQSFDLGAERSNYHGIYRYTEIEESGLDLWLIAGPDLAAVTKRFTMLTGRPAFGPRWSFGFAFTSMHHADDPQAQGVIADFADRCRAEGIAISAIHFGSGYSSRGKRRYVFTWNKDKFPDPEWLFAKLRGMGFPTVANLKPVLIDDHPDYTERVASGGFVQQEGGAPVLEQFWDGMGSYLDFTNAETVAWWQKRLKAQVLDVGFDAGWNDNNEYEIGHEGSTASGFGTPVDAPSTRPLHAMLMTRATFEATEAHKPDLRPYTLTRAGPAGMQRYGETWSGDNFTSWHSLKWNLRVGLSLALSGQSKVGHDIGGFTGPRPTPELLCRWVEMMALHPRALMNSWKPESGEGWRAATVPWLYPEMLPQIRQALHLRTTFLPLIYSLARQASLDGSPIIRPLFYDFPDDPAGYADQDAMMLGPDVLVSPVVEAGARSKRQYLPKGPGWIDYHSDKVYAGGETVEVDAPLGRLPLFIRIGAVLALASETPVIKPHDAPARRLYVAAAGPEGQGSGRHFEDDGLTYGYRDGKCFDLDFRLNWKSGKAHVSITRRGSQFALPQDWEIDSPAFVRSAIAVSEGG